MIINPLLKNIYHRVGCIVLNFFLHYCDQSHKSINFYQIYIKNLFLIILYQKIINILIFRSIKQVWRNNSVFSTEQADIGMVLQAGLPWESDISTEEASKIQKVRSISKSFKTSQKLTALFVILFQVVC